MIVQTKMIIHFQKQFNDIKIETKKGNKIKKTKKSKINKEFGEHNQDNSIFNGMQNISIRVEQSTSAKAQDNQQRPPHFFSKANTT